MTARLFDLGIVLILLLGIALFQSVRRARSGNLTAAVAMFCAVAVIVYRQPPSPILLLLAFAAVGTVAGCSLAFRVSMVGIPGMVALQNGLGGLASFLVSFVELTRGADASEGTFNLAALLGIVVGAATFSGSLVAAGRLSHWLVQKPLVLPHHTRILAGLTGLALLLMILAGLARGAVIPQMLGLALIIAAGAQGVVFSIRVGGADMPVLISFLNAGSGVAAALCGLSIGNWLLMAAGAMVGVSGMILTQVMCRAMNRSLGSVFTGGWQQGASAVAARMSAAGGGAESAEGTTPASAAGVSGGSAQPWTPEPVRRPDLTPATGAVLAPEPAVKTTDPFARALAVLASAQKIIIVPGYGMALADAQQEVSALADRLTGMGKQVVFAIHPVAGRMPGHMHVLLAEAEVDYGMIRELPVVNPEFPDTDLVLIVGACDVVNPAAIQRPDTPISGMPILRAHEARSVVVCNLDDRPGYSGVENPLYRNPRTIMLLGDAKATLDRLIAGIDGGAGV